MKFLGGLGVIVVATAGGAYLIKWAWHNGKGVFPYAVGTAMVLAPVVIINSMFKK